MYDTIIVIIILYLSLASLKLKTRLDNTIYASCARGLEFKSYTALQTVRHHFNFYAEVAVLPWHYAAEMDTANSLHASA